MKTKLIHQNHEYFNIYDRLSTRQIVTKTVQVRRKIGIHTTMKALVVHVPRCRYDVGHRLLIARFYPEGEDASTKL